jgi:hypothetical protein
MTTTRIPLTALLGALALAGCASPARMWTAESPEALLASEVRSAPFCAAGELAQVQDRVYRYLERCHRTRTLQGMTAVPAGGYLFTKEQQNWEVQRRAQAGGGEQYFVRFEHGYVLGAAVAPTPQCSASVVSYAKVSGWARRFDLVNAAARGETPECLTH